MDDEDEDEDDKWFDGVFNGASLVESKSSGVDLSELEDLFFVQRCTAEDRSA
jgi:hypothetical protein